MDVDDDGDLLELAYEISGRQWEKEARARGEIPPDSDEEEEEEDEDDVPQKGGERKGRAEDD